MVSEDETQPGNLTGKWLPGHGSPLLCVWPTQIPKQVGARGLKFPQIPGVQDSGYCWHLSLRTREHAPCISSLCQCPMLGTVEPCAVHSLPSGHQQPDPPSLSRPPMGEAHSKLPRPRSARLFLPAGREHAARGEEQSWAGARPQCPLFCSPLCRTPLRHRQARSSTSGQAKGMGASRVLGAKPCPLSLRTAGVGQ